MTYEELEKLIVEAGKALVVTARTHPALRALKRAARSIERGMAERAAAKAQRTQDAATYPGLSARGVRVLKTLGVQTREAARCIDYKAITGKRTANEIREWANGSEEEA